jgi:thiol-disulfide isomerase/thioredoxin
MTQDQMKNPRRDWLLALMAFLIFWIGYLVFLGPGPGPAPDSLERSGISQPAAYDWSVLDLNRDEPVPFSRFKGKTVFLNIWATWCPPCVREMPSISRLAENPRLRDKGIAFVCISVDDSSEAVRRFLEGRGWGMSFYRAEKLPGVYSTDGIPATFILTPDGKIAAMQVGADEWDRPEVVALLEKLATSTQGK